MSEKKMIETLFNNILDNEFEKKIMTLVINERDSDIVIKALLEERGVKHD
jgi:hypothetical protein